MTNAKKIDKQNQFFPTRVFFSCTSIVSRTRYSEMTGIILFILLPQIMMVKSKLWEEKIFLFYTKLKDSKLSSSVSLPLLADVANILQLLLWKKGC